MRSDGEDRNNGSFCCAVDCESHACARGAAAPQQHAQQRTCPDHRKHCGRIAVRLAEQLQRIGTCIAWWAHRRMWLTVVQCARRTWRWERGPTRQPRACLVYKGLVQNGKGLRWFWWRRRENSLVLSRGLTGAELRFRCRHPRQSLLCVREPTMRRLLRGGRRSRDQRVNLGGCGSLCERGWCRRHRSQTTYSSNSWPSRVIAKGPAT